MRESYCSRGPGARSQLGRLGPGSRPALGSTARGRKEGRTCVALASRQARLNNLSHRGGKARRGEEKRCRANQPVRDGSLRPELGARRARAAGETRRRGEDARLDVDAVGVREAGWRGQERADRRRDRHPEGRGARRMGGRARGGRWWTGRAGRVGQPSRTSRRPREGDRAQQPLYDDGGDSSPHPPPSRSERLVGRGFGRLKRAA